MRILPSKVIRIQFYFLLGLFFLASSASLTQAQAEKTDSINSNSFAYNEKGRRDPFWPLVTASGNIINYDTASSVTDLALEGLMYSASGESLAIVNSKVVKVGDTLGNFTVVAISHDIVKFKKDGQIFDLKLKKEE